MNGQSQPNVAETSRRDSIEWCLNHLGEFVPTETFPKPVISREVALQNLRSQTGQDFGFDVSRWSTWLERFTDEELESELERVFWKTMARKGLPRFRWFSKPRTAVQVEHECPKIVDAPDWLDLKKRLQSGDEIWPFRYPRWNTYRTWGFRIGYIALRNGDPIGGIVTLVS